MEIKDKQEFDKMVIKSKLPTLVDFFAPWCGPCRNFAPILEKVANDFKGIVNVFKINVDDNSELASLYKVRSIPTSIIFKDGEAIDTFIGSLPEEELRNKLNALRQE